MFYYKGNKELRCHPYYGFIKDNITRKDYQLRVWPAGENSKFFKKLARKKTRKFIKRGVEIGNGMNYRKFNEHYDINDFK